MARSNGAGRHDVSKVPDPAAGLPGDMPKSQHNNRHALGIVAISDAYDPQRRVRAVARYDLLDQERRSGKLDEASYLAGREAERTFEAMSRISGGGAWLEGDRIDAASAAELNTLLGIERAYAVNAYLGFLVRHLGRRDTRLLWSILGLRLDFRAIALSERRPGVRGVRYIHDRFAETLATLAEVKAARGRSHKVSGFQGHRGDRS